MIRLYLVQDSAEEPGQGLQQDRRNSAGEMASAAAAGFRQPAAAESTGFRRPSAAESLSAARQLVMADLQPLSTLSAGSAELCDSPRQHQAQQAAVAQAASATAAGPPPQVGHDSRRRSWILRRRSLPEQPGHPQQQQQQRQQPEQVPQLHADEVRKWKLCFTDLCPAALMKICCAHSPIRRAECGSAAHKVVQA